MSAVLKTFEGSWDDVLRHAPELAGHRVLVTVLTRLPCPTTIPGSIPLLPPWLSGLPACDRPLHRPPMRLGDDSRRRRL